MVVLDASFFVRFADNDSWPGALCCHAGDLLELVLEIVPYDGYSALYRVLDSQWLI